MVLEVGSGLGYQTALLGQLVHRVWSVEMIEELAAEAQERLRRQGYRNVGIRIGDGALSWADHAPYDKIIVTAAAERVPPALIQQLKPGGRMVLPTGPAQEQKLTVVEKEDPRSRADVRPVRSPRDGAMNSVFLMALPRSPYGRGACSWASRQSSACLLRSSTDG